MQIVEQPAQIFNEHSGVIGFRRSIGMSVTTASVRHNAKIGAQQWIGADLAA